MKEIKQIIQLFSDTPNTAMPGGGSGTNGNASSVNLGMLLFYIFKTHICSEMN